MSSSIDAAVVELADTHDSKSCEGNLMSVRFRPAAPIEDRHITDAIEMKVTSMKRIIKEFKQFAMRGNVMDLAVGVIIGGAFGKIVTSLVNDIVMPPFGLISGKVNFSNLYINLSGQHYASLDAAKAAGAPTINYGLFLNNVVDFLIIAFVIFLMVRQVNKLHPKETPQTQTKECPFCFSQVHQKATRCPHCTSEIKQKE